MKARQAAASASSAADPQISTFGPFADGFKFDGDLQTRRDNDLLQRYNASQTQDVPILFTDTDTEQARLDELIPRTTRSGNRLTNFLDDSVVFPLKKLPNPLQSPLGFASTGLTNIGRTSINALSIGTNTLDFLTNDAKILPVNPGTGALGALDDVAIGLKSLSAIKGLRVPSNAGSNLNTLEGVTSEINHNAELRLNWRAELPKEAE